MTKSEATPERKRPTLSKAERVAIFRECGGKCWVFGHELDPLGDWHVEDGVLLSPAAKRLKRGRSLDDLRKGILEELADAQSEAERLRLEANAAELHYQSVNDALGPLVEGNVVRFAGEQAA